MLYDYLLMQIKLGHTEIEMLKMDIEGAEYSVIPDILESGIQVRQSLVEFHHRFPGNNVKMTKDTINFLRKFNYKLAYVSHIGEEVTFIKEKIQG